MRPTLLLALVLAAPLGAAPDAQGVPAGLGLAAVRTVDAPSPLRFYAHPGFASLPDDLTPATATLLDSLTFRPGRGRAAVATVPEGFAPELLEADAGHIGLRVLTLSRLWAEVALDEAGRTAWVPLDRLEMHAWAEVLPNVFAVAAPDPEANPIRTAAADDAPVLATTDSGWPLRPLAVRGDWVLVSTLGLADRIAPSGWMRWRRGGRLAVAVTYED